MNRRAPPVPQAGAIAARAPSRVLPLPLNCRLAMSHPYQDPSRPIPERVADLLARMTIDEKIAQMHAFWLFLSQDGNHRTRGDSFTGESDQSQLQQRLKLGLGQITRPLG